MMSGRQEPEPQSANSAGLLHPPDITHTFLRNRIIWYSKCNSTLVPLNFLYLYYHVVVMIKALSGKAQMEQ